MSTFVASFLLTTGIMLLFSIPVLVLAWRMGRRKTMRRFLIALVAIATFNAALAANSEILVDMCEAVNGRPCIDFGTAGTQLLLVIGYVIVALVRAYALYDE